MRQGMLQLVFDESSSEPIDIHPEVPNPPVVLHFEDHRVSSAESLGVGWVRCEKLKFKAKIT
jgi:hypothetical protein